MNSSYAARRLRGRGGGRAALGCSPLAAAARSTRRTDAVAAPAASVAPPRQRRRPFDSQFTRDGTFQSHVVLPEAPDLDFVYTIYPTKSTPRTNEWYPKGGKFFSFTFQAYDLVPEAARRRSPPSARCG